MKHLISFIFFLAVSLHSIAQLEGLFIETYYVSDTCVSCVVEDICELAHERGREDRAGCSVFSQ